MTMPTWKPTPRNLERVDDAQRALDHIHRDEDDETQLADLLADLWHWAASKDVDFEAAIERGTKYFAEEADGTLEEDDHDRGRDNTR